MRACGIISTMNEREQGSRGDELEQFAEDLLPYYRRYMMHVATVTDPASPDHPDRLRSQGLHVRSMRKTSGLSRDEVAQRLDVEQVQLAAFEGGLISSADLPEGFSDSLNGVLKTELQTRGIDFPSNRPFQEPHVP